MKNIPNHMRLLLLALALILGFGSAAAQTVFTSVRSGPWTDPLTWNNPGAGIPDIGSAVTIANGHTVTIDGDAAAGSITVGEGSSATLYIGDATGNARTISVAGTVTINTDATFQVNPASATTGHVINTTGDFINSGVLDLAPSAGSRCIVNFTKNGTQTISGSGPTTNFGLMNLNMGAANANVLDVFAANFTDGVADFLRIYNGTFKISTGATLTPFNGNAAIPATGGLWLNHASAIVTTTGGSLTVAGSLRISNGGTLNVGSAADQRLVSNGGTFTIEQGTVSIAGRFEPLSNATPTNFTMSGGTVVVPTIGSTSATNAPFTINASGSNFVMTGGTIVIRKASANSLGYINRSTSSSNVTGGTLQVGDDAATQTLQISTDIPLFNLDVKGTGTTAQVVLNALTVKNDISIAASDILNANNLNITVGGNWTDNGSFTRGTGTVTFAGASAQTITDPAGEIFTNLTINKESGSVALNGNVTVASAFNVQQGTFAIGANTMTFNSTASSSGTITMATTAPFGSVVYNQASAGQTVLPLNYGNLTLNAYSKNFPSTGIVGVANTLTVPNPATAHVITGSTIDYNGASQTVAAATANFSYNNLSLSGSGTKTASGNITVNGAMAIASGPTLDDAGWTVTVKGNLANDGAHTGAGMIQVNGGAASHTLSGSGTYTNFTMNDVLGAALAGNLTVNGALVFTTGVITTGTDTVYANGTVTRTSGHVNGWLRRTVTTGSSGQPIAFDIGDAAAANYTPAVFTFATITNGGTLSAGTTASQHPLIGSAFIDPSNDVARYWTLNAASGFAFSAAGYTAKFTFLPSDVLLPGNETSFTIDRYAAGWTAAATTIATATTNQGTGFDKVGTFAIGNQGADGMFRSIATGNWTDKTIWEKYNAATGTWGSANGYPKSNAASVSIQSPTVVTVNSDLSKGVNPVSPVVIDAGATLDIASGGSFQVANISAGNDLIVYGTLKASGGTIGTAIGATISVEAGGTYLHAVNGGTIPTAAWNAASNCLITGITSTVPGGLTQTFGNFHWNCPAQAADLALAGNPTETTGEFRITSTGSRTLTLNDNNSPSKTIGGDCVIAGGNVVMKSTGATAYAVTVNGNLTISGAGTTTLTQSSSTNGNVTMTVEGNVSVSTGSLVFTSGTTNATMNAHKNFSHASGTMAKSGTGTGTIVFNGNRIQNYASGGTVTGAVNYAVNSGTTLLLGTSILTGTGSFALSNGAAIGLGSPAGISTAANTGNVQVTGAKIFGTGANYIYNGSAGQATGNALPATVNKLTVSNAAGVTLTASTTVGDTLWLLNGQFSIGANTLTLNSGIAGTGTLSAGSGTVNYAQLSNGQNVLAGNYGTLIFSNYNKILPSSATIGIAGTFTPGSATGHTMSACTINYNGGVQAIAGFNYYNLTTSGSGAKTLAGNATVQGSLSLGGASFSDGGFTLTAKGNISSTIAHSGAGRIYLSGGSSTHLLTGGGAYGNLEINDAYGAVVTGAATINGTLTLTGGVITTTDTLEIAASGTIVRPATGPLRHINGYLKKHVPSQINVPQTIVFEIGTAAEYAPAELSFASVTASGTIAASTVGSAHPSIAVSGLDAVKFVKRYWILKANGIAGSPYDAAFTFVPGDIAGTGANTGYFYIKRFSGGAWSPLTTRLRTSVSTQAAAVTGYGEFAIGELVPYLSWTGSGNDNKWSNPNNWSTLNVPSTDDNVLLNVPAAIDVDMPGICRRLTLDNDALVVTIRSGMSLTVSGDLLRQTAGTLNTEGGFPSLTAPACVVQLLGGTFGYTGTSPQAVPASYIYHSLAFAGSGAKTAQGALTVTGDLTIGAGASFAAGTFTHTLYGSWLNSGTFTAGTSTVVMTGGANAAIGGTSKTTFSTLTVNKTSDAQVVALGADVAAAVLNMTKGRMETGAAHSVEATADLTGGGIIIGTITQTRAAGFAAGAAYRFEGPNNLITFNTGGTLPTSVTETVTLSVPDTNAYMDPISRYYALSAQGGSGYTFTYRLHYEDGEVSAPNSETSLKLWHETLPPGSKIWERKGASAVDASANYAELAAVTAADLAGRWSLSSRTIPNMHVALAQDKTNPGPGEEVTYTITWQNTGDGNATNVFFTAYVPTNTALVPGSVRFNASPTTDYTVAGNVISFNISSLNGGVIAPAGTGTITYKVSIN